MICRWLKEYIAEGESAFIPKGHPGNPFAALHVSKNLSELERFGLMAAKLEIENERLKKNVIIEAINGWKKEELFLDFGLATAKDVPKLLDEYVLYYNNERPAAALGYKIPVQHKAELGF